MSKTCGGCEGLGNHRRWCPHVVGATASRLGEQADAAEALGDSVGPNSFGAANALWRAASLLRTEAYDRAARWQQTNVTAS